MNKFYRLLVCFATFTVGGAIGQATWVWLGFTVMGVIFVGGIILEKKIFGA